MIQKNNFKDAYMPYNSYDDDYLKIIDGYKTAFFRPFKLKANEENILLTSSIASKVLFYYKDSGVSGGMVSYKLSENKKKLIISMENGRIEVQTLSKMFSKPTYLSERYLDLSDYGLPKHVLYKIDNLPTFKFTSRENGFTTNIRWNTKGLPIEYARYFLLPKKNGTVKRILDITNDDAKMLGFKEESDEPVFLNNKIQFLIDEEPSCRNAFFKNYQENISRTQTSILYNPFIYLIPFDLVKVVPSWKKRR